jgi:hypothetical protein
MYNRWQQAETNNDNNSYIGKKQNCNIQKSCEGEDDDDE